MKLTPLTLSILTTSLISGVAIALAWNGPTGTPFLNNAAAPVNVGVINQTKTGGFVSNGLISSGGFRVELDTMLGSSTLAPRNVLEVNGNITNTAALNANGNLIGYNLGVGSIGAQTIYGYGSVCTGNTNGDCTGTGGVVLGGANTAALVNITNTGNSFFNVGNVGIGTNSPTYKLDVIKAGGGDILHLRNSLNAFEITMGTNVNSVYLNSGNTNLAFNANSIERMRIDVGTGNVGVGTANPAQKLSVAGIIESTFGGYKFPDGTTQTTAAGAAGSYIQNQNASAQSANAWVSGNIRADGTLTTGFLQVLGGANIYASTGNTHFGFAGGSLNYLRGSTIFDGILYDENNSAYFLDPAATSVTNDLRTNILYDQGDTAYYVDPAGISRVDTLRSKLYESVGTGADSGLTGARYYQWGYQEGGPWSGTYPDLVLGYHTGVKMGANSGYGGVRFYTDHPSISSTEIFSIGNGDGNVRAVNGIYATAFIYNSDETLKDNIAPIQGSLDKVRALNGYTFKWKQGGKEDVGLVAQQVETVFPELVHTDATTGLKSVQYGNLVAPLIEAVKELAGALDSLATRVFNTEARQTELEKQNAAQAQQIADLQRQISEIKNK